MQTSTFSVTLAIEGMSCGHCVRAVTEALSAVPGVTTQSVTVGSARVELTNGTTAVEAVSAVERAGYPAQVGDEPRRSKVGCSCCGER